MIEWNKLNSEWGYEPAVQSAGQRGAQPNTQPKTSVNKNPVATTPTTGGGTPVGNTANTSSNFIYPTEWDNLGDQWGQMASGNYTNPGMDWLTKLMQSGGGAYDVAADSKATDPYYNQQWEDMYKQAAEESGMGGGRHGSDILNRMRVGGERIQNAREKEAWDRRYGAYEAGMNRAYGAGQGLSQFGLGARQTGLEGMFGLGQAKAQLPLQVANQLNNQEMGWASLLGGNVGNQNAAPQTYTPTQMQSFMQSITSILPSILGAGGRGSFGGSTSGWPSVSSYGY